MIRLFRNSDNTLLVNELNARDIHTLKSVSEHKDIAWIDVFDENDATVQTLLEHFDCHELAIQDTLRKRHPPKLEEFKDRVFLMYRGISSVSSELDISNVQIAFFFSPSFLISVHRETSIGVDYVSGHAELVDWVQTPVLLLSKILMVSAKRYIEEILKLDDELAVLEDSMMELGNDQDLSKTISYKSRLRRLKRTANYHERVINQLTKVPRQYLDFNDSPHTMQDLFEKYERIHSLTALFYELCGDLIEGYLSLASHRLNKTMQILTVITAIFIPLGLLAGIYGMNFDNIPELRHQNGYFILLATMFCIAGGLFYIFKKKSWLD